MDGLTANRMMDEFATLLVIQSTVEEAITEVSRNFGFDTEEVRDAAERRFGDRDVFAWKVSTTGYSRD